MIKVYFNSDGVVNGLTLLDETNGEIDSGVVTNKDTTDWLAVKLDVRGFSYQVDGDKPVGLGLR